MGPLGTIFQTGAAAGYRQFGLFFTVHNQAQESANALDRNAVDRFDWGFLKNVLASWASRLHADGHCRSHSGCTLIRLQATQKAEKWRNRMTQPSRRLPKYHRPIGCRSPAPSLPGHH